MRTPQPHRAPNHSPGPTHSRFEAGRRRLPAADRYLRRLRPRRSPVSPGSPYRLRSGDSPRFVRLFPFHTPVESISARCTTLFFKPSNHLTGSRQKTVHPASYLNLLGSFYPPSSFFLLRSAPPRRPFHCNLNSTVTVVTTLTGLSSISVGS